MQNSARNSIGMLTSSPCQMITCVEVYEIFQNLCRSSCDEVLLPAFLVVYPIDYKFPSKNIKTRHLKGSFDILDIEKSILVFYGLLRLR